MRKIKQTEYAAVTEKNSSGQLQLWTEGQSLHGAFSGRGAQACYWHTTHATQVRSKPLVCTYLIFLALFFTGVLLHLSDYPGDDHKGELWPSWGVRSYNGTVNVKRPQRPIFVELYESGLWTRDQREVAYGIFWACNVFTSKLWLEFGDRTRRSTWRQPIVQPSQMTILDQIEVYKKPSCHLDLEFFRQKAFYWGFPWYNGCYDNTR